MKSFGETTAWKAKLHRRAKLRLSRRLIRNPAGGDVLDDPGHGGHSVDPGATKLPTQNKPPARTEPRPGGGKNCAKGSFGWFFSPKRPTGLAQSSIGFQPVFERSLDARTLRLTAKYFRPRRRRLVPTPKTGWKPMLHCKASSVFGGIKLSTPPYLRAIQPRVYPISANLIKASARRMFLDGWAQVTWCRARLS
jgi:hypothetical protein